MAKKRSGSESSDSRGRGGAKGTGRSSAKRSASADSAPAAEPKASNRKTTPSKRTRKAAGTTKGTGTSRSKAAATKSASKRTTTKKKATTAGAEARALVEQAGDALFDRVDEMLQAALSLMTERFESNERAIFAQLAQVEVRLEAGVEAMQQSIANWIGGEDPRNVLLRLDLLRDRLETLDDRFEVPRESLAELHKAVTRIEQLQAQLSDRMDRLYGALAELTGDIERLRSHLQAMSGTLPRSVE